jgi:hypothetical protein
MKKTDTQVILDGSKRVQLYVKLGNTSFALAAACLLATLVLLFFMNAIAFITLPCVVLFTALGFVFLSQKSSEISKILSFCYSGTKDSDKE